MGRFRRTWATKLDKIKNLHHYFRFGGVIVHLPCFARWGDQPGSTGQPPWYSTKSPRSCRISRVSAFVQASGWRSAEAKHPSNAPAIALSYALLAFGPSTTKGLRPHTLPALILRRPVPRAARNASMGEGRQPGAGKVFGGVVISLCQSDLVPTITATRRR